MAVRITVQSTTEVIRRRKKIFTLDFGFLASGGLVAVFIPSRIERKSRASIKKLPARIRRISAVPPSSSSPSPRDAGVGRGPGKGETRKTALLSPALSSLEVRRGRER